MIAKDIRLFLSRFETGLTALARKGQHVELEAWFKYYQKLLEAWLEVAPPGTSPPERLRFLSLVDRFGGPLEIDLYEIVEAAALSNDSSTVVAVAQQLKRSTVACYHHDQPRLMDEFLRTLVFLYYQCVERKELADAVGHRLDEGLHSLFILVRADRKDKSDKEASDTTALDAVLRFGLALTHAAIRYEKTKYAAFFVERIFDHRKFQAHRARARGPLDIGEEALFDFVAVVLAGWALHILQSNALKSPDAAKAVLDAALNQVPSAPELIAEWEQLRGADRYEAPIDARLGVMRWDIRDWQRECRSGVSEVRSGGPDWIRLGFYAALLRTRKEFRRDLNELFPEPPRRFIWDPAEERNALMTLSADQWLGIPEAQRQQQIDSVMQLIDSRAHGADAGHLRYVLDSPLSESRLSQLRDDAVNAFANKRSWQNALQQAGISAEPRRIRPLRTRYGIWVPREYLLDDNNWASGFGDRLGEMVSLREAIELIHLIETAASPASTLIALATLPEKVREVRRTMTDAGLQPNVLILPSEDRFAGALFRKPLWQVEGRREFGEASVGSWEALHVLRFPYVNPQSILLLDTERLLAESNPGDGTATTRVWIEEDPAHDEIRGKKTAARTALHTPGSTIPPSNTIQVLAWMEVTPRLGLVSTHAAMAIDIRDCDGGYAVIQGSDLYHRPTCPDIEGEDATYLVHIGPEEGQKPCPTCKPERWNIEGRSGQDVAT